MLQIWLLTSKGHMDTHSQQLKFNMIHPQILVLLTDPTSQLQETYSNPQIDRKNPNVGIVRANTTKRTVQQPPNQVPPKVQVHQGQAA